MKIIVKLVLIFLLASMVYASNNKYFIGVSTGMAYMNVTKTDQTGSLVLTNQPSTKGIGINIETGYEFNKSIFMTGEIEYQKYDDVKLYNYLISLNKRLTSIPIYLGIVTGMSTIELTKSHINLPITDKIGKSFAIGCQIGYEKPINNKFSIFTQYRFLKASHKTILKTQSAQSELVRDDYSTLNIGFRWRY